MKVWKNRDLNTNFVVSNAGQAVPASDFQYGRPINPIYNDYSLSVVGAGLTGSMINTHSGCINFYTSGTASAITGSAVMEAINFSGPKDFTAIVSATYNVCGSPAVIYSKLVLTDSTNSQELLSNGVIGNDESASNGGTLLSPAVVTVFYDDNYLKYQNVSTLSTHTSKYTSVDISAWNKSNIKLQFLHTYSIPGNPSYGCTLNTYIRPLLKGRILREDYP